MSVDVAKEEHVQHKPSNLSRLTLAIVFGPFRLDKDEGLLSRGSERVALTPKAFETLVALVERTGRLVEKDELMRIIWPDSFVEEANLTNNIWTLRKALVNARDDNEWTALHSAAQSNSSEVARLLIEAGAEVDPADSFGNTPLSTAVFNYRGNGELIMLLREKNADPYLENHHGQSPLALARLIANYDVAKYFDDLPA